MIGTSTNLNSIDISLIPSGCLKAEFDSTYPVTLNGIISQNEFQESIHRINHTLNSKKTGLIIYTMIFILALTGGTICFIVAGGTSITSPRNTFYILMAIGILSTSIGTIIFSVGMYLVHSRRMKKMRQVVAEESMKYSSRSPIPCSWRLNVIRNWNRGFGYRNNQPAYNLVIDIGNSINAINGNVVYYSNQTLSDPTAYFGGHNDYTPPPYSAQLAKELCSQCNTPRQDLTTKVCVSCEHPFNNY
ncbi:unnamed protein product [Adineta steineri]|uniref:Uncharacterized protein n=2 Tax=Adineta steineri TaxID=433720 RepID=A0A815N8N8_9BILA|nr:unnamed protein product [Adineta steineri]